ncbi:hypothetical protein V8E54_007783 [Elaphomyces granulatus]
MRLTCVATNNTNCQYANGPYYPLGPPRPAPPVPSARGTLVGEHPRPTGGAGRRVHPFPPPTPTSSSSPPPKRPPPPHRPRPTSVLIYALASRASLVDPAREPRTTVPFHISRPWLLPAAPRTVFTVMGFFSLLFTQLDINPEGAGVITVVRSAPDDFRSLPAVRAVLSDPILPPGGDTLHRRPLPSGPVRPDIVSRILCREVGHAILSDDTPRNGFKVQGMLLLAIITFADGDESRARQLLQAAIRLALKLGLNRAAFAVEHAMGSSLLEESWRRTYWELYVVDAMLAALRGPGAFSLYLMPSDLRSSDLAL